MKLGVVKLAENYREDNEFFTAAGSLYLDAQLREGAGKQSGAGAGSGLDRRGERIYHTAPRQDLIVHF